jgi:hypothetical protein
MNQCRIIGYPLLGLDVLVKINDECLMLNAVYV